MIFLLTIINTDRKKVLNTNFNVEFRELEKKFQKLVPFLHVESKYFKPNAFLEAFHFETPYSVKKNYLKKVDRFLKHNSDLTSKNIIENTPRLLEVDFTSYF